MPTRRTFLGTAAASAALSAVPARFGARADARPIGPGHEPPAGDPADLPQNPEAERFRPKQKLGMGGTQIGNIFKITPDDEAYKALYSAWHAGVRYFDTSPFYGHGLSERRLGQFLDGIDPDEYVISTKVGRILEPDADAVDVGNWKGRLNFTYRYDYSAEGVRRSVEDSLQRLGVPSIDIVFIHDLSPDNGDMGEEWEAYFETAATGAMPELTKMREEGLIKAWGMGVNELEPSLRALEEADPDIILQATEYSLIKHKDCLEKLFPRCEEKGVSVVVGAPLNAGYLAGVERYHYGGDIPGYARDRRDRLRKVASDMRVDLRTAALRFTAAPEVVSATIPGARDADQARENVESMKTDIPPSSGRASRTKA